MKYGKRSKIKKLVSSPFGIIVILIVVVLLARATWSINSKVAISNSKLMLADAEFAKLSERHDDLGRQVGRLSTEQGIESEIRAKYKGVRSGESVAVIIGDNEQASATSKQATSTIEVGWLKGLLQKIGL